MKILILGAAGFIGRNLTKKLLEDSNNFLILADRNIENLRANNHVMIHQIDFSNPHTYKFLIPQVDMVYHLISTTISKEKTPDVDIIDTIKLLDECEKYGVKVIFISSGGAVYGESGKLPIKEDSATNPIRAYGTQKLIIENLLRMYNQEYGLDYKIIRLANSYGPYQVPDGKTGIIVNYINNAINDKLITVYGDGNITRDYIYIDDAINCIVKAVNGKQRIYNIGTEIETSINSLIQIIEYITGIKL